MTFKDGLKLGLGIVVVQIAFSIVGLLLFMALSLAVGPSLLGALL